MPRSTPLPESEVAIGRRLRQAREELLIPRTSFALKCGLSTNRLVNYESGRALLPWDVARELCQTFRLDMVWLYKGTGHRWSGSFYSPEAVVSIRPRVTFSEVMREYLEKFPGDIDKVTRRTEGADIPAPRGTPYLSSSQKAAADSFLFETLYTWLDQVPPNKTGEFISKLTAAGAKLASGYSKKRQ